MHEASKLGINIPIRPNRNIFQRIRKDQDSINPLETSGIYKIDFINKNDKAGSYIGMTKRKIKDRIKERIIVLISHTIDKSQHWLN